MRHRPFWFFCAIMLRNLSLWARQESPENDGARTMQAYRLTEAPEIDGRVGGSPWPAPSIPRPMKPI